MSAQPEREGTLFEKALGIPSEEAREAYLREACESDPEMLERLRGLLAAHARAGRFLEPKAPEEAAPAPDSDSRRNQESDSPPTREGPPPDEDGSEAQHVASISEKPGDRIGRYKLLEQIGEGGMGTVWMAEQEEPVRRKVALKIIKLGMDTRNVIARFEAERQALALMDHPNIARVFDGGVTGADGAESQIRNSKSQIPAGRPYFVMELVRGLPITAYCDELKMPIRERLELFGQVCRAVQHAHQKGIIHRDLKPSNILVTEQDGRPVPKVIDFGIAKATGGQLTEKTLFTDFNQVMGTPAYMSPEQAGLGSLDIDTRSDTYSLGVVLYQLLTGRPPFDTKELLKQGYEAVLRTIREVDPPKPSTRLKQDHLARLRSQSKSEIPNPKSEIDQDLDWIVMKCLEKDRNRRYDTPNSLAMDVDRYLHDEPVLARPPSALYRWQKFARKHRTGVAVAAGFLVLLTAATVVSTTLALWANRERGKAHESEADATTVLRFFEQKVLAAARPEGQDGGLGREATIRAAVEAVEPEITGAFTNRPLVEASIRDVLGKTYFQLGETAQALRQHERALDLRQAKLGPDHHQTLDSMNELARAYVQEGRLEEALQLFELALQRHQAKANYDERDLLAFKNNIAGVHLRAGRATNAVVLFEQVLQLKRAKLGPDDPDTLITMHNLADAFQAVGRFDEAVGLMQKTLQLRQAKLPPDHPYTLSSINSLALAYEKAGSLPDALPLYERALKLQIDKLGPDHSDTLTTMINFGNALSAARQPADALPLLEKALEHCRQKLVADHRTTLNAINNLALAYQRAGRNADALPQWEEALKGYERRFGPTHPSTLTVMNNLAGAYRIAGRLEDALTLMKQTLERRQAKLGLENPETLVAMNNLSVMSKEAGQLAEAVKLSEQVLILAEPKLSRSHPYVITWRRNLALAYRDVGRTNDALPLFVETLELHQEKSGPTHSDTLLAMSELAVEYFNGQRWDDAAGLWRQLLEAQSQMLSADSVSLAETQFLLGDCLLRQDKYAEAGQVLSDCLRTYEKHRPGRSDTLRVQVLSGIALLGQRDYAGAEPLLERSFEALKEREIQSPNSNRQRFIKEACERVAHLYEALHKPDKAAEWIQKIH